MWQDGEGSFGLDWPKEKQQEQARVGELPGSKEVAYNPGDIPW
jgi:hypothetical protein